MNSGRRTVDLFKNWMQRRVNRSDEAGEIEPPLRAELFGPIQLERHAHAVAESHDMGVERGPELLLHRLTENEEVIQNCHKIVAEGVHRGYQVASAAEWLLDNFHLIEEQVDLARAHLSPKYSRELPRLRTGPLKGFPRVYDLILELISHTDGRIDIENLTTFIKAYQKVKILNLGELWAVPIMLRLTLLENLRGVASRIAWRRRQRDLALHWSELFFKVVRENPRGFIMELADFVRSQPNLSPAFIAELASNIEGVNPVLGLAINWIEQELAEQGQTIEMIKESESHDQAADQISIGNSITSLRTIVAIDWRSFVEELSVTEGVLRGDPSGIYAQMDFRTRDRYRHVVERLAKRSGIREEDAARKAIELAEENKCSEKEHRRCHVGFFLIDAGRGELERKMGYRLRWGERIIRLLARKPLGEYLAGILAITGLMTAPFLFTAYSFLPGHWAWLAALALLLLFALSRPAIALVNWIALLFVPPRSLPKLDFSDGISVEHRTIVVVPTLLKTPQSAHDLLEHLEMRFLANHLSNLFFALLTDFQDASAENLPEDRALLDPAIEGIRQLNARYAKNGETIFFLLHRPRQWNSEEDKWMGYERKRGKLQQFNRLVLDGDTSPFTVIQGDLKLLRSVRYVITLDADTQLPPGTAFKMVGAMAHPLNRPRIDPATRCVDLGYGVLQPRLGVSLVSARRSLFSWLLAGEVGVDPYTHEVSNLYYDLFGEGQFVGKGIYDIEAFQKATSNRFPENRILSHDMIEGCHARCGFINDVELLEEQPSQYLADVNRRHRWFRGDWQIACWLFPKVPGPDGRPITNRLGLQAKWMIFDNLRRSLVPAAVVGAFLAGWYAIPAGFMAWTLNLLIMLFFPTLVWTAYALLAKGKDIFWVPHLRHSGLRVLRQWTVELMDLAFMPFYGVVCLDVIVCVYWRLLVRRRGLMEWQTASESEGSSTATISSVLHEMWLAPALSLGFISGFAVLHPSAWIFILPINLLWFGSPLLAWFISRPLKTDVTEISASQRSLLRMLARRSWAFFDQFMVSEYNWLPPDNYQEYPNAKVAARTSPTNISMALLSELSAYDFGYLSVGRFIKCMQQTFATMDKLDRYRGHFYNWYDTKTLQPLHPYYISTVDSGNLSGQMIILSEGLKEMTDSPVIPENWRVGLEDTAGILLWEIRAAIKVNAAPAGVTLLQALIDSVNKLVLAVKNTPRDMDAAYRTLDRYVSVLTELKGAVVDAGEVVFWLEALRRQCQDLRDELGYLMPWLADTGPGLRADAKQAGGSGSLPAAVIEELSKTHKLQDVATLESRLPQLFKSSVLSDAASASRATQLKQQVEVAGRHAAERIETLRMLAVRSAEYSKVDVDFLYNRGRNLLSIGYDLDAHRLDPSYYDLLASEARLCSFVWVARGALPVEHWFSLGRQLALSERRTVLVSWSGSLFEYLMPLLVMPSFEGTLLDETHKGAVDGHIRYGKQRGIPWGFSESCYNQMDTRMTYQYRAFGVPGLGLKRGLAEDMVVAPYASLMALMVAPREALKNIGRLSRSGLLGKYGLYEAVDYTPKRVERGERFAIVKTFMAHHTGMGMLGLNYVLNGRPMQRRFMRDPQMRASVLLLQERIPLARAFARSGADVAESADRRQLLESSEPVARVFKSADTSVPEVHLLSNGRYHTIVTNAGTGFSRWKDMMLTRWREDITQDSHGMFFYLRDIDSGSMWSTTFQPTCKRLDRYEVTFTQGIAEFRAVKNMIDVYTRIAVSPEDDVEIRRMVITNLSNRRRTLEITSFAEVVLLDARAELTHPVFCSLFVKPEILPDKAAILFTRRPKSADEHWPWMFHSLLVQEGHIEGGPSFQTDRSAFIGRGRSRCNPAAIDQPGDLANPDGVILDPASAMRYRIRLEAGQSATLNAILGVGGTREEAYSLMDRYHDYRIAERVFEMAWTHSQVLLHQLHVEESDALTFAKMASSILYASPQRRCNPSLIIRNRKNQSGLWSYGISGDLPIVLLRIADQANLELVRKVVQAHTYWRRKGLSVDLIILAEAYAGYRQNLLDSVIGLVQAGTEAKVLDQPAGIFVRNVDQVPEDDRNLFQAVARIVLKDRSGTLSEQIDRRAMLEPETEPLKTVSAHKEPVASETNPPERQLVFFNGFGGFTTDGREYVIHLAPGVQTPAPWSNVLANERLGSVISESGGTYTWYQNARLFRLSTWHNDPVCDPGGEAYYIRDEETGRFWSPAPKPATGKTPYVCRHGLGYSAFEHTQDMIFTEMFVYVAAEVPLKFVAINVRNLSDRQRRISVTGYCEWVLGETREQNAAHIVTRLDPQTGAIFAGNAFNIDFEKCVAAFHCSHMERSLTGDRTEFIGRNGTLEAPAAMLREKLSNRVGAAMDPCAAIQAYLTIEPQQQEQIVFVLGAAENERDIRRYLRQFGGVDGARQALEATWQFWNHQLGGIYVETPDASVNFMTNYWLPYQVLASRFWGRSGYYQSGGAYGFRDQLQDSLSFLYDSPWFTRKHLLYAASRQFTEGDVQHWWHEPVGRGVRTRISDDALWLPYVVCRYVEATGDTGILDEEVSYLEGRILGEGEESYYDRPLISENKGKLYEHCVRVIQYRLQFGQHGLPLMGSGDWNDGMNRVGHRGQGESVWLAFFLYHVLDKFGQLASGRKDQSFADKCRQVADELKQNIEKHAWDGEWYLRAFFDDGTPLGSSGSPECRIDSLPQSWAVLSGAADMKRAGLGLDSVLKHLVDRKLNLVKLFAPPFDSAPWNPGYIKGYAPGVRENGGQYTHAAIWYAMAFAELKDSKRAWELFGLLNPIGHADTKVKIDRYKVEPYVMAADLYTAKGHEGRGGWTWYTGSAGWMYQLLIEKLLGLRVEANRLTIAPLMPQDWPEFSIVYRYRSTYYHIKIRKTGEETWNTRRVLVDDVEQPDKKIPLVDDGRERKVYIEVG